MISDLQGMTGTQLKALSRAQLIDHIMSERTETKVVEQVGDSRGMLYFTAEDYNYRGELVGVHSTTTTYFADGSVDTISKLDLDASGVPVIVTSYDIVHDGQHASLKNATRDSLPIDNVAVTLVEKVSESLWSRLKAVFASLVRSEE